MNEQIHISLTIINDRGETISPLVRQDVPLDGQFTNLVNTLTKLNAIKDARSLIFNIHPVDDNGKPVSSDHSASFWMVSFVTRHPLGTQVTQDLLPFKSRTLAEDFTRRLLDGFQEGRKIQISTDPQFMQQEVRPSAEIHQLIRPASPGFSPGS